MLRRLMPILRGAVTLSRYKVAPIGGEPDWKTTLERGLKGRAFVALDREGPDDRSAGFVELENHDGTEFNPGAVWYSEYALFTWRIDEIRIPASAVRNEMNRWKERFEKENHRAPSRRERNDARDEIRHDLRSRIPVTTRTFDVSWNVAAGEMQLWAGSRKALDELEEIIEQSFAVKLTPVNAVTVADELGIPEQLLQPTPGLSLPEEQGTGGRHS